MGVDAVTANSEGVLFIPDSIAVILAVPVATPVAKPVESILATLVLLLAQVTCDVISAVEPSEYVPVAVNAWVEPIGTVYNIGATAIEDSVSVGVGVCVSVVVVADVDADTDVDVEGDFDEQEQETGMTMVNPIINVVARQ